MKSSPRRSTSAALVACLAVGTVAVCPGRPARAQAALRTYETKYYVIRTDLGLDVVREAAVRMTAMAVEYHRRTEGFSGIIRRKLPFFLFANAGDYHAAGGPVGTSGVFMGNRLMAAIGEKPTDYAWQVVQHEGFHQFARAVIRGQIPVWVNEGLAEYFGQAVFTGDGFVVGVVPPRRLARLKKEIQARQLKSFREMMAMSRSQWSGRIAIGNYDQAWSMIHFLVHAENGKHVRALSRFMNDIARHQRYEAAWVRNFGRDVSGFEDRWRQHWLGQPPNPTRRLYDRAVVATMTSYFARAASQRQKFTSFEEFVKAARAGELKAHGLDWLPAELLTDALTKLDRVGTWSIQTKARARPRLICAAGDGTRFVGTFSVASGRVKRVNVDREVDVVGEGGEDLLVHPRKSCFADLVCEVGRDVRLGLEEFRFRLRE